MRNLFSKILNRLPLRNFILFESIPVYSDNTKYVFDELVNRGYNRKYKMYWVLRPNENYDATLFNNLSNVYFLPETIISNSKIKKILHYLKFTYVVHVAKVYVSCNRIQTKFRPTQYCINLAHGEALKNCRDYYTLPDEVDEVCCLSPFLAKYDAINFNCDTSKMQPLGYARNDLLFGEKTDLKKIFYSKEFNKAIYWLPTYRQHRNGKISSSDVSFPIIYNDKIAQKINKSARENDVIIIIKPHPAQDLSLIKNMNLSNLVFIDNDYLRTNSIENYELLRSVDAMITDYSSVYYDYLLCDKPIALCFDDFEEFNSNQGFTVDPNMILKAGEKIYNDDDLCEFIVRISNNEDILKNERAKIIDICHLHKDNNSTKRIVDRIVDNLEK